MVSAMKTDESADSTYVDVKHEELLVYWMKRLQVSPLILRQTVRLVGPRFKDVAAFLSQRRQR
jgi:hypothetical protein